MWWSTQWQSESNNLLNKNRYINANCVASESTSFTTASSNALFGEDLLAADEIEDALVEKLLTQFPVYGTCAAVSAPSNSSAVNAFKSSPAVAQQPVQIMERMPTAQEWLQMGLGLESSIEQDEPDETRAGGTTTMTHRNEPLAISSSSGGVSQVLEEWDAQEELLWRTPSTTASTDLYTSLQDTVRSRSNSVPYDDMRRRRAAPPVNPSTPELAAASNQKNPILLPTTVAGGGLTVTPPSDPVHASPTTPGRRLPLLQRQQQQQQQNLPPDRQHWMPDQLCKQCYSCDTQFTVFRRRHHCRLCGQVFCNACSAHFVPSAGSTIRVCHLCFAQVMEQGGVLDDDDQEAVASTTAAAGDTVTGRPIDLFSTIQTAAASTTTTTTTTTAATVSAACATPTVGACGSSAVVNPNARLLRASSVSSAPPIKNEPTVDPTKEGHRHLGMIAANHLEKMAQDLLRLHAPILLKSLSSSAASPQEESKLQKNWINQLLTLATRCCATVSPSVMKGDFLDIRPYCKVKAIPGGSYRDCAYLSGILFRKTVSHKKMAKEIQNPRIMLLSGGIEFTRAENQIASLETLFEQEEKYMEILVGKIIKLRPDLLLVGRSVSRRAQELLLKASIVLVQHVKSSLLSRISRQTGATIISSTDHVMTAQFGSSVLGKCGRFRLVTFRNNELWVDHDTTGDEVNSGKSAIDSPIGVKQRSVDLLLKDPNVSTVERESALAAKQLGQGAIDGSLAVKSGLAKRGVANTYVMLQGCPKNLGATIVLRGASRAALKQVKTVFRFLVNAAYNLRLETSYLRERGARMHPDFVVLPEHKFSSSLAVDFGQPPSGRKVYPWNGGNNEVVPRPETGEITAFDHQSILITSVWMTGNQQCCPAEVKGICYYSLQDVALGQFLRDSCFNLSLKCQNPNCKKTVLDHSLSFVHNDGLINIMVEELENVLPSSSAEQERDDADDSGSEDEEEEAHKPIATWTYCSLCEKVVTPLTFISEETWKLSFGKFLEISFYNRDAILNAPAHQCSCPAQSSVLYFGCSKLAARFTYESVSSYGVFVRKNLPLDLHWHRSEAMRRLEVMSVTSSELLEKFDKHINKVARETRSLFNSAINRPEHLQTVLLELNRIGQEVDHATKTIQEKIASVTDSHRLGDGTVVNDTLLRFPGLAKRYIFMLMSTWNEKLSVIGQVITTMKKLAGVMGSNSASVVGDPLQEELLDGMKRLKDLNEQYARYKVADITQGLPSLPTESLLTDYEDEFDEPDTSLDFADGVDADVLASRRRLQNSRPSVERGRNKRSKPTSSKTQTSEGTGSEAESSMAMPPKSAGGAMKSAITRLFNRGGRENDAYAIDLGIFGEGRPRLPVGVNNIVVPVIDDQLSTIIAYSMVSPEYAKIFKHYSKTDGSIAESDDAATSDGRKGLGRPAESRGSGENQSSRSTTPPSSENPVARDVESRMINRKKSHIKITFRDHDQKGRVRCKFSCTSYWATQFHAVREVYLSPSRLKPDKTEDSSESSLDTEQSYIESLSSAYSWAASGGKSGATFARTSDDRFVIKNISRTELQMFLECSSAYFEYLSKAFFHGLPTVLCKIVGVYQIAVHNRITGKESRSQVAIMQNIFYNKKISMIFDLKGSLRGRFASQIQRSNDDNAEASKSEKRTRSRRSDSSEKLSDDGASRYSDTNSLLDESKAAPQQLQSPAAIPATLLDGDFLEFTLGRPMPLTDRAKALFQMSILNDTLFLSIINVLDYSILVGVDLEKNELVVGIIDFMRQYDILKQMERVGKSLPMVVGSEAPTIIQPPLYKARFTNAMERYFMTVPSKWTSI